MVKNISSLRPDIAIPNFYSCHDGKSHFFLSFPYHHVQLAICPVKPFQMPGITYSFCQSILLVTPLLCLWSGCPQLLYPFSKPIAGRLLCCYLLSSHPYNALFTIGIMNSPHAPPPHPTRLSPSYSPLLRLSKFGLGNRVCTVFAVCAPCVYTVHTWNFGIPFFSRGCRVSRALLRMPCVLHNDELTMEAGVGPTPTSKFRSHPQHRIHRATPCTCLCEVLTSGEAGSSSADRPLPGLWLPWRRSPVSNGPQALLHSAFLVPDVTGQWSLTSDQGTAARQRLSLRL